MIHYTGASDDYIWLSGLPEDTETLVDAGGIDVLLAPGFTTGASLRNIRSTAEGIEVRTALGFEPSGVTIARDPDSGLPGIEFLEWRGVDFSNSGGLLPVALGTFRIIEDLAERSALPFAYAGSNRAETLDLPGTRLSRDLMNEAYLNGGDDTALLPRGTAYRVFGGNGDDTITARGPLDTELNGDRGDDVLRGAGGDDLILGGRGADLLIGRDGDDFLRGEDPFPFARNGGKDTLRGGDGDDTLAGGFGNDRLIGGAGEDTFHFTLAGGGIDRVLDFDATQDSILFDSDTFPGRFRVRDDGENTHLHWGRFKFAVLKDVVLTADEIDFAQGFI